MRRMPLIVNGDVIDDTLIREEARILRPQFEVSVAGLDPVGVEMQLRELARENVVNRVLLRQEAMRDPEPVAPELVEQQLERIRTDTAGQARCGAQTDEQDLRKEAEAQLRLARLIGRIEKRIAQPRNSGITDYYKKNKHQFWTDELVHVKHIVKNVDEHQSEVTARAAMERVQAELQGGGVFEEIANRDSDCPGQGGDLGYFPRGEMVEEFERVVFNLQIGETSDIFRTVFGFHLARLYGRKPAGLWPLSEVRGQIAALLLRGKRERAMADFLDKVRSRSTIQASFPVKV